MGRTRSLGYSILATGLALTACGDRASEVEERSGAFAENAADVIDVPVAFDRCRVLPSVRVTTEFSTRKCSLTRLVSDPAGACVRPEREDFVEPTGDLDPELIVECAASPAGDATKLEGVLYVHDEAGIARIPGFERVYVTAGAFLERTLASNPCGDNRRCSFVGWPGMLVGTTDSDAEGTSDPEEFQRVPNPRFPTIDETAFPHSYPNAQRDEPFRPKRATLWDRPGSATQSSPFSKAVVTFAGAAPSVDASGLVKRAIVGAPFEGNVRVPRSYFLGKNDPSPAGRMAKMDHVGLATTVSGNTVTMWQARDALVVMKAGSPTIPFTGLWSIFRSAEFAAPAVQGFFLSASAATGPWTAAFSSPEVPLTWAFASAAPPSVTDDPYESLERLAKALDAYAGKSVRLSPTVATLASGIVGATSLNEATLAAFAAEFDETTIENELARTMDDKVATETYGAIKGYLTAAGKAGLAEELANRGACFAGAAAVLASCEAAQSATYAYSRTTRRYQAAKPCPGSAALFLTGCIGNVNPKMPGIDGQCKSGYFDCVGNGTTSRNFGPAAFGTWVINALDFALKTQTDGLPEYGLKKARDFGFLERACNDGWKVCDAAAAL